MDSTALLSLLLLQSVYSQNTFSLLADTEIWHDDYAISSTDNKNGWQYIDNSQIIIGEKHKYHGWYTNEYNTKYYGYFYRSFQCLYKSTLSIRFNAYYGCTYTTKQQDVGDIDGGELYINEHKFKWNINEYRSQLIGYDDSVALYQASLCNSNKLNFSKLTLNYDYNMTKHIILSAFTTFDIGFRSSCNGATLENEFCGFSNITVQCNKINKTDNFPDSTPQITATPTIENVTNPIINNNFDCFNNINDNGLCNDKSFCKTVKISDGTICGCNSIIKNDIIFGIDTLLFDSNEIAIKNWLRMDVLGSVNINNSRIGISLFGYNNIHNELLLNYYNISFIEYKIKNIEWLRSATTINIDELINDTIIQFDNINNNKKNKHQILVIVTDETLHDKNDPLPICQYRNALFSRNIRVVVIGIGFTQNNLYKYQCILQYSWDLIPINNYLYVTYNGLHNITNILSSILCGFIPISPTNYPTSSPTLYPIEIKVEFKSDTNITMEVIDAILIIVANKGNLEKDKINITISSNIVTIKAKGDEEQIDGIQESVNNGDLEKEIEEETGEKVTVTVRERNYVYPTATNKTDSELKNLIIGLIVALSILTFVIIIISIICCYFLFIKKQNINNPITTETTLKGNYNRCNNNYPHHHQMVSISSITANSTNLQYDENGSGSHENIILEYSENDRLKNKKHIRERTGEYDLELTETNNIINDQEIYNNHYQPQLNRNIASGIKTTNTHNTQNNNNNNDDYDDDVIPGTDTKNENHGDDQDEEYNKMYGRGKGKKTPKQPINNKNESSDDDDDAMYIKSNKQKKTKGK